LGIGFETFYRNHDDCTIRNGPGQLNRNYMAPPKRKQVLINPHSDQPQRSFMKFITSDIGNSGETFDKLPKFSHKDLSFPIGKRMRRAVQQDCSMRLHGGRINIVLPPPNMQV
jgi:hypothetical protein